MRPNTNFPHKRKEIVKIALDLFIQNGYEGTNITEIMRAANLSKGGMYHYFASKEEILDAVIVHALEEERLEFEKALEAEKSVEGKLKVFISTNVYSQSEYRKKFAAFRKNQRSLIVVYRCKEWNKRVAVPYLQKIIKQGVEEGIFLTENSREMAMFLYLAGETLFSGELLGDERTEHGVEQASEAFVELLRKTLGISDKISTFKKALIDDLTQQFVQDNDGEGK